MLWRIRHKTAVIVAMMLHIVRFYDTSYEATCYIALTHEQSVRSNGPT